MLHAYLRVHDQAVKLLERDPLLFLGAFFGLLALGLLLWSLRR